IKTAWKSWSKGKELDEEQALTYPVWAFSQNSELEEVLFAFYIIVMNKKPKIDIREVKVKRDDVQKYLALLESRAWLIDSMLKRFEETGDPKAFPANPKSWACGRSKCPAWQECEKVWGITIKD
ncbi:MAG: hypothetical protein D6785_12085, partial [Planctomycetota bacterium]